MKTLRVLAVCLAITGCAGGGGGGAPAPGLRAAVPFHTPVLVTTVEPLVNTTQQVPTSLQTFAADFTGTGVDNVVLAGRQLAGTAQPHHDSRISVLGWSGNQLVNQTSQWFSGTDNIIRGTEPSVKFADFNQDGRLDMFVANGTDGLATVTSSQVFFNEGNRFRRYEIDYLSAIQNWQNLDPQSRRLENNTWLHDSDVVDINRDGFLDIITAGYTNASVSMNNGDGTFNTQVILNNASGIVGADFLGNGTTTFLAVDSPNPGFGARPDLFTWGYDAQGRFELRPLINDAGPAPRFQLPKWDGKGFDERRNHDVRILADDWDNNGVMDAIVLSRPWPGQGQNWSRYSEIQFLKNDGSGHFTDSTDSVLVGYNTNMTPDYNPKWVDFNGDGLKDLFLSSGYFDQNGQYHFGQILIRTADGKFVSAHTGELNDLSKQVTDMTKQGAYTQSMAMVRGPDNKMYIVANVSTHTTSQNTHHVYIAQLGANVVTAEQAVSTIQSRWPWMSAPQVNEVLSRTAATYLNGALVDMDRVSQPVGGIGITVQGQSDWRSISGYLAGLRLDSPMVRVTDGLGRDFQVNLSSMAIADAGIWGRTLFGTDQMTMNSQGEHLISAGSQEFNGMRVATNHQNYSVGTPQLKIGANWAVNAQYTNLPFNPWLQLDGVWGHVHGSSMLETVGTYRDRWFQAQAGLINVDTNLSPGLVSRVSNITAAWTEMGYNENGLGLFMGVRPVVLAGHAEANLPTGVDQQGNLLYTKTKLDVVNPVLGYVRAFYSGQIMDEVKYQLSGMFIQNGQYRAMAELKFNF